MSICIAATCEIFIEPKIVLCFDSKVSSTVWSSETEFKVEELIPARLLAMFAGPVPEARELISIYRTHLLPQSSELKIGDMQEGLRVPLGIRKRRMAESIVQRRLGLTYDEFMEKGGKIDEGLRSKIFNDIDYTATNVELIIAGFFEHELYAATRWPTMFRVIWDQVEVHQNFTCIDAGAAAAEQALHRRKQQDLESLPNTLYNVYEAKKLGELAPSVGARTSIMVVEPPADKKQVAPYRLRSVSTEGMKLLDGYYQKYGPKPTGELVIPEGMKLIEGDEQAVEKSQP